jgi:quinol monooxygenase YgiN
MSNVILAGTVRFPLEKLDAALAMMTEMMRLSRAEDGCVEYVYSQDLIEPELVHVFEVWRDEAALHGHHTAPHFEKWKAERSALGMTDRRLFRYDVNGAREA